MDQLSVIPVDRDVVDRACAAAASPRARFCRWRRDPVTGALSCFWTTLGASRESASAVPLRRAS